MLKQKILRIAFILLFCCLKKDNDDLPGLRTRKRYLVYFPSGHTHGVLVGGVAPPQRLDQRCSRLTSPNHMFLTLLLLNFERKTRAQYSLFITYIYIDYIKSNVVDTQEIANLVSDTLTST